MNKKLFSLVLALTIVLSSVASFAAPLDLTNKVDATKNYSFTNFLNNSTNFNYVAENMDEYIIEASNGYLYNALDVNAAIEAGAKDFLEAIDGLTPVEVPTEGELKVVEVSAINKVTINVTFNKPVTTVNAANFKLAVGGVEKAIDSVSLNEAHTVATIKSQALNYKDVVAVKVLDVDTLATYEGEVTMPSISDLYMLEVTPADEKIKADGATKTLVTAKLINKQTGLVEDVDGLIQFTTTKGQFAQGEVALQDGKASVQLTSAASDEVVIAYINATVKDSPVNKEYEGIAGTAQVMFVPEGKEEEAIEMVTILDAESNQADRIFLTMSGKVTKASIINGYPGATLTAKAINAEADGYGFRVDSNNIIKDVIEKSDRSLELILDVDNAVPTPMIEPGITGETQGYLRDNRTHNVSIPANVGKALISTTAVNFKLTDAKFPSIFGVDTEGDQVIRVRFSEAMAEDQVEETSLMGGHRINNHFRLDGKEVMMTAGARATEAEKQYANLNNYILANKLYVSNDDIGQEGYITGVGQNDPLARGIDSRHIVTIILDRASRLATGQYELQASRLGDWAGMTDTANVVQTQTFYFDVETDTSKPSVTIKEQSPEQWLISFSQEIDSINGKYADDVFKLYIQNEYNKNPKGKLVLGTDYQIRPINQKEIEGKYYTTDSNVPTLTSSSVVSGQHFLVEFMKDWTDYYKTATTKENYFTSTKNPYVVEIDNVENAVGNQMGYKKLELPIGYDGVSPIIENAFDATKTAKFKTVYNKGEAVFVIMSEPVKLNDNTSTLIPTEGITESEQQAAGLGVPIPTYEFVKGDVTVNGTAKWLAEDDYTFVVEPDKTLTAGKWTLYIRSISDDVGNTSPTNSFPLVIEEGPAVSTDTRVAWVGFDNVKYDETSGYDRIYIKFTKEMSTVGANSVARTENYVFQGQTLPQTAEVKQGIKGVTNGWDGVTINLPRGTWDGLNGKNLDFTSILNVANNFKSTGGEDLTGPYELELIDTPTNNVVAADDYNMNFEAIYHNGDVDPLLENVILRAEAADLNKDGYIDEITLVGNTFATYSVTTKIKVNGVTFKHNVGNKFIPESGKGVEGTSTKNLSITTVAGSTVIGAPFVVDNAAPVMVRATQKGDKVTFYFSEDIESTGPITNVVLGAKVDDTLSVTAFGDQTIIETNPDTIKNNYIEFKKGSTGFAVSPGLQYANVITGGTTVIKDKALENPITQITPTNNAAEAVKNIKVELDASTTPGTTTTGVTATPVSRTTDGVTAVTGTASSAADIGTMAFAGFTPSNALEGYKIEITEASPLVADANANATLDIANKTIKVVANDLSQVTSANIQTAIRGLQAGFTALGLTDEATEVALVTVTGTPPTTAGTTTIVAGTTAVTEVLGEYSFKVLTGVSTKGKVKVVFNDGTYSQTLETAELNVGTDVNAVATAIGGVLSGDATIAASYTVAVAGDTITLTQIAGTGTPGVTVTITVQ